MKTLYYATESSEAGDRLQRLLETIVSPEQRVICRSREEFFSNLRQPSATTGFFILLATTKEELNEFFIMRKQFSYLRIILILPDRSNESIAKGNALHPRYLDFIDSDFQDVCAVMRKMMRQQKEGSEAGDLFPNFVRDQKGFRVELC